MHIYTLPTGDSVYKHDRALIVQLGTGRKVLSTAHLNGGYQDNIAHILNFDSTPDNGSMFCQNSETYVDDLRIVARGLELEPRRTVAISTTVHMDNAAIWEETYKDLTITAIVTAGIAGNAGRVGDPAWFHEEDGIPVELIPGTINMILVVNLDLQPGTMSRCIVTATEAKTAALQELMAGSVYSNGLATGTGTDETVVVCDGLATNRLMFAGKHSKLGELIGITVKHAVKFSLQKHSGFNAEQQASIEKRLGRFGFNTECLLSTARGWHVHEDETRFVAAWHRLDREKRWVAKASLLAHLLDQLAWGMLPADVVVEEVNGILKELFDNQEETKRLSLTDKTEELQAAIMEQITVGITKKILQMMSEHV